VVVRRERLEGVALPPPVKEIGIGIADRVRGGDVGGRDSRGKLKSVDGNEFVGVGERERAKEDAIDQAEDGGGGSDAERQCEDSGQGEPWAAAKIANSEDRVLEYCPQHGVIMTGQKADAQSPSP
jgi:hypothetical protein